MQLISNSPAIYNKAQLMGRTKLPDAYAFGKPLICCTLMRCPKCIRWAADETFWEQMRDFDNARPAIQWLFHFMFDACLITESYRLQIAGGSVSLSTREKSCAHTHMNSPVLLRTCAHGYGLRARAPSITTSVTT